MSTHLIPSLTNVVQAVLVAAVSYVSWNILKRRSAFLTINKIPGPKPTSWFKGSFFEVFGLDSWNFHEMMREKYGPTSTFSSLFGDKYIYTFDPKAMHHILIKDQYAFEEQPVFILTNKLLFGNGLLSTLGEHHRKQRKMLNPVFSIAHMRDMLPTFNEITLKLRDSISRKVQDGPQEVEILSWMSRTALELVGQSGLGYSFDPLTDENCAHPYPKALKGLLSLLAVTFWSRTYVLPWLTNFIPARMLRTLSFYWPSSNLHQGRELSDYMWQLSLEIYHEKMQALNQGDQAVVEQIGKGKDIMSVLINENLKASEEDRLDEGELIGQMSTLIFAAMDTTSSALARTLLLLAENPSVQTRLREELVQARQDNDGHDLGYDTLVSLPYLDCICRETLRLYPPVPRLMRTTAKDTVLPLSTPVTGTDGSVITEIPVPAHTNVYISILGSNRNTSLWGPDALEWKPERWLEPLPAVVPEARIPGVYSHLMTFNGGGRSCIGFKFSQLEMKVVLAHLIETFEFAPTGEKVYWQYAAVSNPFVRNGGKTQVKLPMRISLVNKA
ncbi:cytochrome p450 [Moniliophthora roreri MCA 2997]|uniref:Cytochrome p450 n=1 Tax=Moniliophthora roreri (strain MCA 2997) TaxID=1381753 RepID=V2XC63_MONRO|nr:cytochrome p450 [Moniliophthora roreri MCA 2997]